MTALRFQTGEIHQTSPASPRGVPSGTETTVRRFTCSRIQQRFPIDSLHSIRQQNWLRCHHDISATARDETPSVIRITVTLCDCCFHCYHSPEPLNRTAKCCKFYAVILSGTDLYSHTENGFTSEVTRFSCSKTHPR